jgi:integrase/recombinase XerD
VTGGASFPVATEAQRLIHAYLETSKHGDDLEGPLFRPVKKNTTGELRKPMNPKSVYDEVVNRYGKGSVSRSTCTASLCIHFARPRQQTP